MIESNVSDIDALRKVVEVFQADCESIADLDWTRATPCSDWNLESLINHVIGGNRFTVAILNGSTADDALRSAVDSFRDRATDNAEAVSSMWDLDEAFREPGALTSQCHHIEHDLTGHQVLRLRLHDLIIHTWDIEQTVNPPGRIPKMLLQWGLAELGDPSSLASDHFSITSWYPTETGYLSAFGRSA